MHTTHVARLRGTPATLKLCVALKRPMHGAPTIHGFAVAQTLPRQRWPSSCRSIMQCKGESPSMTATSISIRLEFQHRTACRAVVRQVWRVWRVWR